MTDAVKGIHVSVRVRAEAIMARPRSKPYRPFYSYGAIGASRASGLVVMPSRRLSERSGAQVWGQRPGQLGGRFASMCAPTLLPVDCLAAARKGSSGAKKDIKERARCRMAGLE